MKTAGFTMIELVVVIVIIGIIAAFGSPSFSKAIARAKARDAINTLSVIHTVQALYKESVGGYLFANDLAGINTGLSLNLVASGGTSYACNDAAAPTTCTAGPGFTATATLGNPLSSGSNPSCSPAASCP